MPISSFEKAALLLKSYKIQLAVLLFLVLDQLVTLFVWNFSEYLIERKALVYSPLSTVLLTKFGLSVSSVWSPGLIEKLTLMKWPCDLRKVGTARYMHSWLCFRRGVWIRKIWSGAVLFCYVQCCLPISFTLKNIS